MTQEAPPPQPELPAQVPTQVPTQLPDELPAQVPTQLPDELPSQVPTAEVAAEVPWQRLDSRMLLVHPVQELVRFFPAVLGAFFLGGSSGGAPWELIGIAIPIALGVLRYFTTSYRVTPTQVELRRGLIGTKVLTARLDRVRAVELTSTLIHRVLGLGRVEIGTASAGRAGEEKFALDSLALAPAREMRTALLHRVTAAQQLGDQVSDLLAGPGVVPVTRRTTDEVLVRFDPAWVRYAPLTSAGNVIAAGLLAVVAQFGERAGLDLSEGGTLEQWFLSAGIVLAVALVVVSFLVLGAILAVLGYLVANWDFTLSRDARGRSLHTVRGLLTRTETSLESARLRGLELGQPLGLRLAGAARLNAVVTGVSSRERSSSTLLVPPAPRAVAVGVGEAALGLPGDGASPLRVPLRAHGPAARRRRLVRSLSGAVLVLVAVGLAAGASTLPWASLVPALLLLPLAAWLGLDRYRQLGHTLTGEHLVVASGTLRGRRDVLQRSGIIGWNIEESFFQRRAGLCTLTATTAAGKQQYAALDIPVPEATALASAAVPGLLEQFLA